MSVLFAASAEEVAARIARTDGDLEAVGPDRARYTARVDSHAWLADRLHRSVDGSGRGTPGPLVQDPGGPLPVSGRGAGVRARASGATPVTAV